MVAEHVVVGLVGDGGTSADRLARKLARLVVYASISIAMQMALEMNLAERGLQRDLDIYTGSFENGPQLPSGAVVLSNLRYLKGCTCWFAGLLAISAVAIIVRHRYTTTAAALRIRPKPPPTAATQGIVGAAADVLHDGVGLTLRGVTEDYDGCIWMIL